MRKRGGKDSLRKILIHVMLMILSTVIIFFFSFIKIATKIFIFSSYSKSSSKSKHIACRKHPPLLLLLLNKWGWQITAQIVATFAQKYVAFLQYMGIHISSNAKWSLTDSLEKQSWEFEATRKDLEWMGHAMYTLANNHHMLCFLDANTRPTYSPEKNRS